MDNEHVVLEGEVIQPSEAEAAEEEEWPWPQYPRGAKRTRDYATAPNGMGGSTPSTGWEGDFLDAYRESGVIAAACRRARVNPQTVKNRRTSDTAFAQAFDEASEEAVDRLEAAAIVRARDGVRRVKGVWYQGERVGEDVIREYSDGLLKFLLEHKRPQVYRETIDVNYNISLMRAEIDRLALSQGWSDEQKQEATSEAMKLMGL